MADPSSTHNSQPKIVQDLVEAGKKAFDPSLDASSREAGLKEYHGLVDRTETWALLPALNTLIKPNVLPPWLSQPFMQTLTLLPLRPDGVRGTMEFVFSVHPSNYSPASSTTAAQKQGASITHEAVAVATRLLSSVPASMTPQAWFQGISEQLFCLMDGDDGPDLARTASQIVGFGILGKKQLGAPGAPGWNVFVQPLLQSVNPSLKPREGPVQEVANDADVIDLSRERVLVTPQSLERALRRLKVLILSNPSPGLCRRVLKPVLPQLWTLASWAGLPQDKELPRRTARALLETYVRLFGNSETASLLIQNVLCKGSVPDAETPWRYRLEPHEGVCIVAGPAGSAENKDDLNWGMVEEKAVALVDIITTACSAEDVSSVFLDLLRRWIKSTGQSADISLPTSALDDDSKSPLQDLVEVTVLQKLLDKAPEKLVSQFDQLLELICQVLKADGQAPLADDLVGVVLSLLNLVITAPTFSKSDINPDELKTVEVSLARLIESDRAQISQTASNLALLLKYRGELDQDDDSISTPSTRQIEDRRTYNLAMNYITGADNPPPVVSEGLSLLSGLIVSGSSILDVTAVTVLLSNLLTNNEDYINLRIIKIFTQLVDRHPKSTVSELLDHYLDAQEKASTDTRLRFGEALLQVIERLGEAFSGEVAQQVSETLLSIAGRRGYRPKTQAKQMREERLRELKKKKEAEPEEGVDEDEDMTEEEKTKNDILARIVQGWESKRGAEDVRMRTSALSIFGTALETNIGGIGPTLASGGVDLCINVLTLEPEMEKGVLRRAAILVVLGFIGALQKAKEAGRSLGFGLTDSSREDIARTLQYIAETDNDGLVQQHARDVIESLENWQMASLLPTQEEATSGLSSLAGLQVNPEGNLVDRSGCPRPRIEEVE